MSSQPLSGRRMDADTRQRKRLEVSHRLQKARRQQLQNSHWNGSPSPSSHTASPNPSPRGSRLRDNLATRTPDEVWQTEWLTAPENEDDMCQVSDRTMATEPAVTPALSQGAKLSRLAYILKEYELVCDAIGRSPEPSISLLVPGAVSNAVANMTCQAPEGSIYTTVPSSVPVSHLYGALHVRNPTSIWYGGCFPFTIELPAGYPFALPRFVFDECLSHPFLQDDERTVALDDLHLEDLCVEKESVLCKVLHKVKMMFNEVTQGDAELVYPPLIASAKHDVELQSWIRHRNKVLGNDEKNITTVEEYEIQRHQYMILLTEEHHDWVNDRRQQQNALRTWMDEKEKRKSLLRRLQPEQSHCVGQAVEAHRDPVPLCTLCMEKKATGNCEDCSASTEVRMSAMPPVESWVGQRLCGFLIRRIKRIISS